MEFVRGHLGERPRRDPAHGAQSDQKSCLEAVARTDRIHDLDLRRLDIDHARTLVPGLRAANAARDDEELGVSGKQRFRPLRAFYSCPP